ncbi:hypothetical protein FA10DRAFT_262761 [Acaromyces ingoldii]|uniref:Uncharacterized protein n=1 Tax=Acaromyces ingoldii TaxID=215250 RepID=A0A316YDP3_9BASI|nr:hypothetical protein FA10DRAFT_262761 [Acaromyces ingoldii]PWN86964.1 hypothetical protein FA10DRAFT_262761 [Acaromyces ingoldii]
MQPALFVALLALHFPLALGLFLPLQTTNLSRLAKRSPPTHPHRSQVVDGRTQERQSGPALEQRWYFPPTVKNQRSEAQGKDEREAWRNDFVAELDHRKAYDLFNLHRHIKESRPDGGKNYRFALSKKDDDELEAILGNEKKGTSFDLADLKKMRAYTLKLRKKGKDMSWATTELWEPLRDARDRIMNDWKSDPYTRYMNDVKVPLPLLDKCIGLSSFVIQSLNDIDSSMQPTMHFALLALLFSHSLGQPFPLPPTSQPSPQNRWLSDSQPKSQLKSGEAHEDIWESILRGSPLRDCRGYLSGDEEHTRYPLAVHAASLSSLQYAESPCPSQSQEESRFVPPTEQEPEKKRMKRKSEDKDEEERWHNGSSLQVAEPRRPPQSEEGSWFHASAVRERKESKKPKAKDNGEKISWPNDPISKEKYREALELVESKEKKGLRLSMSSEEQTYLQNPGMNMFRLLSTQRRNGKYEQTHGKKRAKPRHAISNETINYHLGKLNAVLKGNAKGTTISKSNVETIEAILLELLRKARNRIFEDWKDDTYTYCVFRRNYPFPLLDEVLKASSLP